MTPVVRDFRGNLIRCLLPRPYTDARGQVWFAKCRNNTCAPCFAEKVLTNISAMRLSPLSQSGVVTLLEDTASHVAAAKELRIGESAAFRFIQQETGIFVPRASVVEISDAGRVHDHIVTRGEAVSSALFAEGCERAGLGYAALEPIHSQGGLSNYLYTSVLPPFGEGLIVDEPAIREFLALNAGRVISTRGPFWIDRDGSVLAGVREASKAVYRAWLRSHHGDPVGTAARSEGAPDTGASLRPPDAPASNHQGFTDHLSETEGGSDG